MGIPNFLRYVLNKNLQPFNAPNQTPFNDKTCHWVLIDGHMVLYNVCYMVTDFFINRLMVADLFVEHILKFLTILNLLSRAPIQAVYLSFDGPLPSHHKRVTQHDRDRQRKSSSSSSRQGGGGDNNDGGRGLGSLTRSQRDLFINLVSRDIERSIRASKKYAGLVNFTEISFNTEEGETDVKFVKKIENIAGDKHVVILNNDSDIFISMIRLRQRSDLTILLDIPSKGYHYITSEEFRRRFNDEKQYRVLIFFIIFFVGCDYEPAIVSGTKNQINSILDFLEREQIQIISTDSIIKCWLSLNTRCSVKLKNDLTEEQIIKLINLKMYSVSEIISFYCTGRQLSANHPTMANNTATYLMLRKLYKNINLNNLRSLFI